jgi:hypothetical protein
MKALRQVPLPLRIVAGMILGLVAALLVWAAFAATERTNYDFAKDVVIPLVSPIVALFLPIALFYFVPLSQNKQRTALELFNAYHSEEMRRARNEAWNYFVTERRSLPDSAQEKRLDDFLNYLTQPEANRVVPPALDEIYQKASKVLDFFALVDACLERDSVDRGMVRSFIAYYFLWWHAEVVEPLTHRPVKHPESLRFIPLWWGRFDQLQKLCRRRG